MKILKNLLAALLTGIAIGIYMVVCAFTDAEKKQEKWRQPAGNPVPQGRNA